MSESTIPGPSARLPVSNGDTDPSRFASASVLSSLASQHQQPVPWPQAASAPSTSTSSVSAPQGLKRAATQDAEQSEEAPKPKRTRARNHRSRAACQACKTTKQKCDGPNRGACRRCRTYGLECSFGPAEDEPVEVLTPRETTNISSKVDQILSKLAEIETALSDSKKSKPWREASESPRRDTHDSASDDSSQFSDDDAAVPNRRRQKRIENPVAQITDFDERYLGSATTSMGAAGAQIAETAVFAKPDIIDAGMLSSSECQRLFDFFFETSHGWVMVLADPEDRDALAVRKRSSLLFHAILCIAASFQVPYPSPSFAALLSLVNTIVAPMILNPQPHEVNTDLLRALDLLNVFKQTQLGARRAEGHSISEAVRLSKVNGTASWMLQGILSRAAERLDLSSSVPDFLRYHNAAQTVPKQVLADLRLFFRLVCNDLYGNLQAGNRCNMEGTASALTATRQFAQLNAAPYDIRLAGMVELLECARSIVRDPQFERTRRMPRAELEKLNARIAAWEEHWIPVLLAALPQDRWAMTLLSPFRWFITLVMNASACTRFHDRVKQSTEGSGDTPSSARGSGSNSSSGGLSRWEQEHLAKSVQAAESLIFTLSVESRVKGRWRQVQWSEAERADGFRRLIMDEAVISDFRYGLDAVLIAFIYPLVFLSRLFREGLLTSDLEVLKMPALQPAWRPMEKLPRLLELGATFLDRMSEDANHPSKSQALIVRKLLEAGLCPQEETSSAAAPRLPTSEIRTQAAAPAPDVLPVLPAGPAAPAGGSASGTLDDIFSSFSELNGFADFDWGTFGDFAAPAP